MTSPLARVRTRLRAPRPRAVGALVAATGLLAGLAVLVAPTAASAATVTSYNPIGMLHSDIYATTSGISVHGWALDQDQPTANVTVLALIDGVARAHTTTTLADPGVVARYHSGPTPGFRFVVPVPTGKHTLCVAVRNLGRGVDTVIACMATPLTRSVTASQKAAHSPTGVISAASASRSSLHVSGFATDPDYLNRPLTVVLYVDGQSAATLTATRTLAGAPKGSGSNASFDVVAPVSTGTHQACVWAVNVGWGSNAFLGCTALDTRAGQPIAAGAPSVSILPKVLAEAKKHIGQPYVWGAVGPKSFDCSGLVKYSYSRSGFTTPRISEDQSRAARLIPASKARPGDLVFYHDTQGDVYHVGIYLGPGQTVAAIDEAEGVNYQQVWDPSSTTYGSFTHV